jgi:excinuclease ABC subunit B
MMAAADALEFERAAGIRDRIERMRNSIGKTVAEADVRVGGKGGRTRGKGGRLPRPKR